MAEIYAQRVRWSNGVEIISFQQQGHRRMVAKPVVYEEILDECAYQEPTITLNQDMAQKLMDELWHCGFRPSEGSGSAGALKATQQHLDDMRKLVFKDKHEKLK